MFCAVLAPSWAMLGPSWGVVGVRWGTLKVWREVREIERVAGGVKRGWRRAKCCFLQWLRNSFAVGVGVSGAVGWRGQKVWLQDVLFFVMVLQRFLMGG